MSIALVVDAACDLPFDLIKDYGIVLVPISITVDHQIFVDDKDPEKLHDFYQKNLLTLEHEAESIPYSTDQMAHLMVEDVLPNYDFALVQTVSQKRSIIHDNFVKAQHKILKTYREQKDNHELDHHFGMRVMNSSSVFSGQGLLAIFTAHLIKSGRNKHDILRLSEAFKKKLYAFVVPPDVGYIRERARRRGEDVVSLFGSMVAKTLDIKPIILGKNDDSQAVARIRGYENAVNALFDYCINRINSKELLSPNIVLSYAGDLNELTQFSSYSLLLEAAHEHKVAIHQCVMGLTTGLNCGPGAVSIGLAAEDHEFDF